LPKSIFEGTEAHANDRFGASALLPFSTFEGKEANDRVAMGFEFFV